MTELRVMAVTGDGDRLVLRAPDGQEFFLAIDDRLRAAVRGDRARLGQIEIELDAQLRPRDIQARIRGGQTAEQVADMAGIPLERVRRFEGPVLAERAFMAERAQNTQVRRAGETHGPKLGDVVRERLSQREPDHDSTQWDSWRREDGVWTVRLAFRIGGLPYEATWAFDPPRRLVTPADDEARLLSSDVAAENAFPFTPRQPRLPAAAGGEPGRPTSSVTALPTWQGRPSAAASASASGDSVVTPLRPVASAASASPPTAPAAEEPAARRQAGAGSAYSDALFGPVGPHKDRLRGSTDQQAVNDGVTPGKRATVPSWDEIVFGTRRRKGGE
ncbi:MAG TPA: septation protein SepH [Actinocrinis sp.]|uniref:septation protein SepH n=1 Tax=Actinocrinis sp. TaxID=1920516 RepID=UPI002DDCBA5A|nr:septation protein SepH [Actinocrinis sp.]HEV2346826.1 septation protein SepH [Actinocrinis sp.]